MKKILFLAAITFLLGTTMNAQTQKAHLKKDIARIEKKEAMLKKEKQEDKKELQRLIGKEVSERTREQFKMDFTPINESQWERTDRFDEATFMKDGKVMTAFYDANSTLVGTTCHKNFPELPANAQLYINENYKSYVIEDILEFDDNEPNQTDMVFFNQSFKDADNYFVELKKDNKKIVLMVNKQGDVSYFTRLR
ncbi:MAG: hypothetical protein V4585_04780 [Bacteroidota bacterium]|jgi:hypothetical protein